MLEQASDDQVEESIRREYRHRKEGTGNEYWKTFPLRSVQEVRAWQGDCQRIPENLPTSTVETEQIERSQSGIADAPPDEEPQSRVSAWNGAPSADFQRRFLW